MHSWLMPASLNAGLFGFNSLNNAHYPLYFFYPQRIDVCMM
jgi:hypothetical protein